MTRASKHEGPGRGAHRNWSQNPGTLPESGSLFGSRHRAGALPADQGSMPTEDRSRLHQQPAAVTLLASQGRQRLSLLALVWARDWLAPR
jgi:hypothetical protein